MKFRKIFGVSVFRWFINGIVFMFFCFVLVILGMTSYSFYFHYFGDTKGSSIEYSGRISGLEQIEPRLYSFISRNSDKTIFLLFIDFKCYSCVKFWKRIEREFDSIENEILPVLVTSNLSNDIPLRYLLYDKRETLVSFFGLQSDPSGIVIRNMKIIKYLNSPEEMLEWLSL
ncbi:MAG: hypothetical protein R6V04_07880 [bacterium]